MSSRLRQQFRDAVHLKRFPVTSWMLAGACLCGLAINEVTFVRPERRRQERTEAEASAVALGTAPKELPGGRLLMPDGRVVRA